MLPRNVIFLSLFMGILFTPRPFVAKAQTNEMQAPDTQTAPFIAAGTPDFPRFAIAGNGSSEQSYLSVPAPSLLSTDAVNDPRRNADERENAAWSAQPETEAHIDLLPLFAKWHEDTPQHQAGNQSANLLDNQSPEGYHWKGLLWESFGFLGV